MVAKHNSFRRDFIKKASVLTGGMSIAGNSVLARSGRALSKQNPLPRWKGFNLLDFFSPNPKSGNGDPPRMIFAGWLTGALILSGSPWPTLPTWTLTAARTSPPGKFTVSEEALERVDQLVFLAHKYKLHVSLNLHRAPGYCINAGFREPYNLWKDEEAREAFYWHWQMWANRYKNISSDKITFDLLNEPAMIEDMNNQHSSKTFFPVTHTQMWP